MLSAGFKIRHWNYARNITDLMSYVLCLDLSINLQIFAVSNEEYQGSCIYLFSFRTVESLLIPKSNHGWFGLTLLLRCFTSVSTSRTSPLSDVFFSKLLGEDVLYSFRPLPLKEMIVTYFLFDSKRKCDLGYWQICVIEGVWRPIFRKDVLLVWTKDILMINRVWLQLKQSSIRRKIMLTAFPNTGKSA